MSRIARLMTVCGLGLSLVMLAREADAFQAPPLDAKDAVSKMMEKPGDVALAEKLAGPFVKDRDVVMKLFKPRSRGGFGIGDKAPPGIKDGIELAFGELCDDKGGTAKVALAKGADLDKAAKQTQALAELNAFLGPKESKEKKTPAAWKAANDAMKAGAEDLAKAAAAKDSGAIKKAALKISNSCNDCHVIFRD